jgi:hypothetical protein
VLRPDGDLADTEVEADMLVQPPVTTLAVTACSRRLLVQQAG